MADLDDLDMKSITEMGSDEAIELIRQIRLSRRTVEKTPKTIARAKTKAIKAQTPTLDNEQAAELLKLLKGTI